MRIEFTGTLPVFLITIAHSLALTVTPGVTDTIVMEARSTRGMGLSPVTPAPAAGGVVTFDPVAFSRNSSSGANVPSHVV
jgi:hypothetical protein